MAWVQLTVPKYKLRFSATESAAVMSDQASPDANITEFLKQAASDILSRVNACRKSRGLAAIALPAALALYVPPGAERHAYTIAQSLQAGSKVSPLGQLQGEVRVDALKTAEDYLDGLASCDIDADDTWASQYAPACETTAPVFGGFPLHDFVT